ncbi:MAG: ABC transporter permease [Streptosporangiaceae bacterium]
MSAVLTPDAPASAARAPALKVTQGRVLRSEFTKFSSLRSTVYTLLVAVVLMIGIGALFSAVTASQYHTFSAADKASFDATGISLAGVSFAVVAFGVLGVLMMSGEYSTGMIRSSLSVVPRRLPVLWAKLAVFTGMIFSISLVASFISFFFGQALLGSHHLNVALSAPGALRSVRPCTSPWPA